MYSVVLAAPVGHWKGCWSREYEENQDGRPLWNYVSTQVGGDGWRMERTAGQVDISLELDGQAKPRRALAQPSIWPLQSPTKWERWFALEFPSETEQLV